VPALGPSPGLVSSRRTKLPLRSHHAIRSNEDEPSSEDDEDEAEEDMQVLPVKGVPAARLAAEQVSGLSLASSEARAGSVWHARASCTAGGCACLRACRRSPTSPAPRASAPWASVPLHPLHPLRPAAAGVRGPA
jgi:hypothetical protein